MSWFSRIEQNENEAFNSTKPSLQKTQRHQFLSLLYKSNVKDNRRKMAHCEAAIPIRIFAEWKGMFLHYRQDHSSLGAIVK